MTEGSKNALLLSISSDIGTAIAKHWIERGWTVAGTYRTPSPNTDFLASLDVLLVECDLLDTIQIEQAINKFEEKHFNWDVLVLGTGDLNPIGPFSDVSFDQIEQSINTNLVRPLRFLHEALRIQRSKDSQCSVVLFAGGGVNNAPTRYFGYTLSKVAMVKACELLDAECSNLAISVLGPGWVNTKIHEATKINAHDAGKTSQNLFDRLKNENFVSMDSVVECVDWLVGQERTVVGGRNFSAADDPWRNESFAQDLKSDDNLFKLRRNKQPTVSRATRALSDLIDLLPQVSRSHSPQCSEYRLLKRLTRHAVEDVFGHLGPQASVFPQLGSISLPYFKMGVVDSLNLLDIDELILLSFYVNRKQHFKRVADIGANIGFHSILMSRCGFDVESYEPDPKHFEQLIANLTLNKCDNVTARRYAVSDSEGEKEFTRIEANSTGSHLTGSKKHVYGHISRFPVTSVCFSGILSRADFIKIDVEGHELVLIESTAKDDWLGKEVMMEVSSEENAIGVFNHLNRMNVPMFSQKTSWSKVIETGDMPFSYKDGSLFISGTENPPWHS